jgi:competence protein ComEA
LPWLERLRSDPRVAAAAVAVVLVAAGVAWFRASDPGAPPVGPVTTRPEVTSPTTVPARVLVHVVGAVERAGVVELVDGARVHDAIDAAGGATGDADLAQLNLAAPVADGQRVAVPRVGEVLPVAAGGTPGGETPGVDASGLVNLNTATAAQLEELPGIGPTLARAIIAERERSGGFRKVEDLQKVRGIGEKRFGELRELVTV